MRTGACARMPPASRTTSSGARAAGGAALRHFRCRLAFASRRRRRSRQSRRRMLRLQPLKDRADGSAEAGQDVELFEDLILLQRVGTAVGVAYVNRSRLKEDRPNGLASMLEIQVDFGLQTVGRFGRYDFNSKVRCTAKPLLDAQLEALTA